MASFKYEHSTGVNREEDVQLQKAFLKNKFREKKNYKFRLTEFQITRICEVFNVWDMDEDGKCWSELHPTGDRDYPRNDVPNLLRSLGELPLESKLSDFVEIFDPSFKGQFDLSAFLTGMATYYRDQQIDEGDIKIPGEKGKTRVFWCTPTEKDRNEYIRDYFFTHFHNSIMQAHEVDHALTSKGDVFTADEIDIFWSIRCHYGANKGQVCFPRKDEGTIDVGAMYETLIEGIDAAIENAPAMNETPKTQFSSPAARSVKGFDGTTFHVKS